MIPLFEEDGFIICFEAEEETVNPRQHFIKECGWSEAEYRKYQKQGFAWFSAKVSAWKDGRELAAAYLGCCSYKTVEEFYTVYKDAYFADMVKEAIADAQKRLEREKAHAPAK
jgi:hypothetical protein